MAKQIKFEGNIHSFPDDATDEEINQVLGGAPAQTEESFLSKLPRNITAGVAGLGHRIMNAPYDLGQSVEHGLQSFQGIQMPGDEYISRSQQQDYSAQIPHQQDHDFAQMLGQQGDGTLSDRMIQGMIAHAPEVVGAGKLGVMGAKAGVNAIKGLSNKFNPDPFKAIQAGHDTLKNKLSKGFESVGKEVKKRDIGSIPINPKIFKDIKEIGPKTRQFKSFVDKAKDGDFDRLRKLQTELFNRGTKRKASPLGSEQDVGEEMLSLRDDINDLIHSHLAKSGSKDLAEKLKDNMTGWRGLQQDYYAHPTISKLVGENRKIPSTQNVLKEESSQMDRLRKLHPEIKKKQNFDKKFDLAKKILTGLGISFGAKKGIELMTH